MVAVRGGKRTFEQGKLVDAAWPAVSWGWLHVDIALFALVVADVHDIGEAWVIGIHWDEMGVYSLDYAGG